MTGKQQSVIIGGVIAWVLAWLGVSMELWNRLPVEAGSQDPLTLFRSITRLNIIVPATMLWFVAAWKFIDAFTEGNWFVAIKAEWVRAAILCVVAYGIFWVICQG